MDSRADPRTSARSDDVGVSVVNAIAAMMSIDDEWSTREERGFTWWGKDYAQRVWSEPGFEDGGFEIFQGETSLLTVTTRESHPQLGNGALIELTLPVRFPEQDGPRFAGELNRRELESRTRSHFLGTWCWHDEFLRCVTFLPNVLNLGHGDLFNFLTSSYGRAKWVAETIFGDDWSEHRDASGGDVPETL
jgi:hypothetical protein